MLRTSEFKQGLKAGAPIALGYIPIAITFGVLSQTQGVPLHIPILMSVLVFAGASQFIALNLLYLGTGGLEIILTTFVVNLRHLIMSASVARRIKQVIPDKLVPVISFGITDETFSLISLSPPDQMSASFVMGVQIIAYLSWVSGTALGVLVGGGLPDILQASMGIALYAMFIGLLVPNVTTSQAVLMVVLLAMGINTVFHFSPGALSSISDGWAIIITTVLASAIGAAVFPKGVSTDGG